MNKKPKEDYFNSKGSIVIRELWESKTVLAIKTFLVSIIVFIVLLNKEDFTSSKGHFNYFTGIFSVLIDLVIAALLLGVATIIFFKLFLRDKDDEKVSFDPNKEITQEEQERWNYEQGLESYYLDKNINQVFIYSVIFSSIAYNKHNFLSDGEWTIYEGLAHAAGGIFCSLLLYIVLVFIKFIIPEAPKIIAEEKKNKEEAERLRVLQEQSQQLAKKEEAERIAKEENELREFEAEQERARQKAKVDALKNISKKLDEL